MKQSHYICCLGQRDEVALRFDDTQPTSDMLVVFSDVGLTQLPAIFNAINDLSAGKYVAQQRGLYDHSCDLVLLRIHRQTGQANSDQNHSRAVSAVLVLRGHDGDKLIGQCDPHLRSVDSAKAFVSVGVGAIADVKTIYTITERGW